MSGSPDPLHRFVSSEAKPNRLEVVTTSATIVIPTTSAALWSEVDAERAFSRRRARALLRAAGVFAAAAILAGSPTIQVWALLLYGWYALGDVLGFFRRLRSSRAMGKIASVNPGVAAVANRQVRLNFGHYGLREVRQILIAATAAVEECEDMSRFLAHPTATEPQRRPRSLRGADDPDG